MKSENNIDAGLSPFYGMGRRYEDILIDIDTCSHRYWKPVCNASEETKLLTLATILSRVSDLLPFMKAYSSSPAMLIRYYEETHEGLFSNPDRLLKFITPCNPITEGGRRLEKSLMLHFHEYFTGEWSILNESERNFTTAAIYTIIGFVQFWHNIALRTASFTPEDIDEVYEAYKEEFLRDNLPIAEKERDRWMIEHGDVDDDEGSKLIYDDLMLAEAAKYMLPTMPLWEASYTIEATYIKADGSIKEHAIGQYIYNHRANQSTCGVGELLRWALMRQPLPPRPKSALMQEETISTEPENPQKCPQTFLAQNEAPRENFDALLDPKLHDKLDSFKADIYALLDGGSSKCPSKHVPYTIYRVMREMKLIVGNESKAIRWFKTTFTTEGRWQWTWNKLSFSDIGLPFTYPISKWLTKTEWGERSYERVLTLTAFAQQVREALAGYV